MKNLSLIFFVSLIFFTYSCKDKKTEEPPKYTIKGHVFYGTVTKPLKNQVLEMEVYKKGFLKDWDFVTSLGKVTTDADGYFEFTYSYQKEGSIINIGGQYTDNKLNPINTDIDKNFYNSFNSTVALFLNTNNKLTSYDTFFINRQDQTGKSCVDTVFGNHSGYLKTFRSVSVNLRVNAGKGYSGFPINDDFTIFYGRPELVFDFPLKSDPYIDSVYINY